MSKRRTRKANAKRNQQAAKVETAERSQSQETGEVDEIQAKHQIARRLRRMTDGKINLTFEPTVFFGDDPEAKGHVYLGNLTIADHMEDEITLDDRQGDVDQQFIDELQRVGNFYLDLARQVATQCNKPGPAEPKSLDQPNRWLKSNDIDKRNTDFCTYIPAFDVLDWLTEHMCGDMAYEFDGRRFARVHITNPQAEILVSCCEPIRMQLRKECRRVAEYFTYLAGLFNDLDYCDEEVDHFHDDIAFAEWAGSPPDNLLREHRVQHLNRLKTQLERVRKTGVA